MKAIILDYLRRWKWVFILTGAIQLFVFLFVPPEQSAMSLFTVIYCGSMLLSFDLARGTPRVCLALPVTRGELASSWRITAIAVPLLLFAGCLIAGSLVRAMTAIGRVVSISQTTYWIFFAFLWLGVSFHLLIHFPSQAAAQDPGRKVKNNIIGGLWGLTLAGGVLVAMKMPKDWGELQPLHWVLMAVALVSTGLGWMDAEQMVVNRAGPGRAAEDIAKLSGRGEKPESGTMKAEGMSFLLRVLVSTTLRMTGVFLFILLGFQLFLRKDNQESWLETVPRVIQEPMTFYILVPLALVTGLQWLVGIRHLRTLPIRSSTLTLLVCGFFVLPTVILVTAMGALQFSFAAETMGAEWVSRTSFMTAPMLLLPGLLLYFGLTWRSYFLVIMPVFMSAPLGMLVLPYLSLPMRAVICSVMWVAGWFLIHHSITGRSQTFRHTLTWPMRPA